MRYLLPLILILVILITPATQTVYAQNILDEIGQLFDNLTSGLLGNKDVDQSSTNSSNESSALLQSISQSRLIITHEIKTK